MIAKSLSRNGSSVTEKDDAFWGNAIIVYDVTIFTVTHISRVHRVIF